LTVAEAFNDPPAPSIMDAKTMDNPSTPLQPRKGGWYQKERGPSADPSGGAKYVSPRPMSPVELQERLEFLEPLAAKVAQLEAALVEARRREDTLRAELAVLSAVKKNDARMAPLPPTQHPAARALEFGASETAASSSPPSSPDRSTRMPLSPGSPPPAIGSTAGTPLSPVPGTGSTGSTSGGAAPAPAAPLDEYAKDKAVAKGRAALAAAEAELAEVRTGIHLTLNLKKKIGMVINPDGVVSKVGERTQADRNGVRPGCRVFMARGEPAPTLDDIKAGIDAARAAGEDTCAVRYFDPRKIANLESAVATLRSEVALAEAAVATALLAEQERRAKAELASQKKLAQVNARLKREADERMRVQAEAIEAARQAAAVEAAAAAAALEEARLKAESDAVAFKNANEVARWEAEREIERAAAAAAAATKAKEDKYMAEVARAAKAKEDAVEAARVAAEKELRERANALPPPRPRLRGPGNDGREGTVSVTVCVLAARYLRPMDS